MDLKALSRFCEKFLIQNKKNRSRLFDTVFRQRFGSNLGHTLYSHRDVEVISRNTFDAHVQREQKTVAGDIHIFHISSRAAQDKNDEIEDSQEPLRTHTCVWVLLCGCSCSLAPSSWLAGV